MEAPSTPIRAATGLLSALALASLIWGLLLVFAGQQPNWGAFVFELVVLASAVFGTLFALGRFPRAPGLTLASIAGCIFISTGLALLSIPLAPTQVLSHPLFLSRFFLVAALTVLAALVTLGGDRLAWKSLIKGTLLTTISIALIAAGFATKSAWLAGTGFLPLLLLVVSLVLLTALAAAFCVGVHLIIRAFETATKPSV